MKYIILFICLVMSLSDKKPSLDLQQFLKIGDYKITYINDGGILLNAKSLYPEAESKFWEKHKDILDENGNLFMTFGGFLFEAGNKKVLMDAGVGPDKTNVKGLGIVPGGGPFMKNLEKAGVKPEDITDVFFSHLHKDNIGWATTKKNEKYELTFPKAIYWCNDYEWQTFERDLKAGVVEENEDLVDKFYEPMKNVIRFTSERTPLSPGLYPIIAAGHSPGHTILKLEADGKNIWFISDIFQTFAEFHDILLFTDTNSSKFSKETRIIILPEFCKGNAIVAAARFGPYVFGKLSDKGKILEWEPCTTKECKYYLDGRHLAFQVEDL